MDDSSPSPSSSTSPSTTSSIPYTTFGMTSHVQPRRKASNHTGGGGAVAAGGGAATGSSSSSGLSPDREGTVESQESLGVLGVMEGMEGIEGIGGHGFDWGMDEGFEGVGIGEDVGFSDVVGGGGGGGGGSGGGLTGVGEYNVGKIKQEEMDRFESNIDSNTATRYQDNMLDFTNAMLAPEVGGGIDGNQWPRPPFSSGGSGAVGGFESMTGSNTGYGSQSWGIGHGNGNGNGNVSGTITPLAGGMPTVPRPAPVIPHGQVQNQRMENGTRSSMLDKVSGGPMLAAASTSNSTSTSTSKSNPITTIQQRRQQMEMGPLSTSLDSIASSLQWRAGKGGMMTALTSTSSSGSISSPAINKAAGGKSQTKTSGVKSAPMSALNTPAASTEEEGKATTGDGQVDTAGWNVVFPDADSCERLPILIRGIKRKGAKSRVETQIKMKISIVKPSASYPSDVPYPSAGGPSAIDILTPPSSAPSRLANLPSIGLGHRPSTSSATSTTDSSPDRASYASTGGPSPFDKVGTFKAFKLQKGTGMKRRGRKSAAAGKETETSASEGGKPDLGMLYLQTEVYCVESGKRAYACAKCRARELKRTQSKIANRVRPSAGSDSDDVTQNTSVKGRKAGPDSVLDGSDLPSERFQAMGLDPAHPPSPPPFQPDVEDERHNIVVFNCGPIVEMEDGECELPGRVTCYCRHHKEKQGFRLVLNLRNSHGKIVASGTTPPIMITDDHKTSGRTSAGAAVSTDGNVSAAKSSGSTRPRPGKKSREGSVSTEDSRVSSSRPTKSKPYDRKPPSEARSIPASNGAMSPRSSFAPHSLSMTPLHGRSMPGSPLATGDPRTSYFSPTGMSGMNLPGSGAITPSLLQPTGRHSSGPASPQGLTQALPAISETLSAWAGAGGAGRQNGVGIYGLGMDTGPVANAWMQMEDDRQTYSSEGDAMPTGDVLMEAATLESLRLDAMQGFSPNGMDATGFHGQGNQLNNGMYSANMGGYAHDSPSSVSAPSTGAELDADFSSMINFSPTSHPFNLPGQQGLAESWSPSNSSQNGSTWSGMLQQQPQSMYMPHHQQQQQMHQLHQSQPPPPRVPTITRLVPAEGPTVGGIEVTVLGENFTPGMLCSFGLMSAVTVQHYGPTTLVCLLPPSGQPGPVSVSIHDPQNPNIHVQAPSATFTYQDVSDRKLMEMALTAVGLRVTGKVHGAVEIARRIMSAPEGQNGNGDSQGMNGGQQQQHSVQHPDVMAAAADDERLAEDLARSIYSGSRQEFETAIIRFLGAFIQGFGNPRLEGRRKGPRMTAVNHINGEGQTILHLASFLGMEQLVRLLVRADATVDIHDRNGFTALAFATIGRRASVARFLITSGGKPNACAFSGATPRSLALQSADEGLCAAYGSYLYEHTIGQSSSHRRRPSTSDSSLDGDNPSSTDDADSAAFDLAETAMSPRKLTTQDDVRRARSSIAPSAVSPKSDGSATPTITHGRSVRDASETLSQVDEHPPPYAAGDAANWLHRTLSHLPASSAAHLKDYIPPSLWDKMPSAHVLVPNMQGLPTTALSESQAWLAVPLSAWLNLLPGMSLETAQIQDPPAKAVVVMESSPVEQARAVAGTSSTSNLQKRRTGERLAVRANRRSPGSGYGGDKLDMGKARRGGGDTMVNAKKPDRMLFLFWLPILMVACIYTAITTVPVLLGRAFILPVVRILGRG